MLPNGRGPSRGTDTDNDRVRIEYGDYSPTSRRELLAAFGVGGAGLLAGCPNQTGNGNGNGGDSQTLNMPLAGHPDDHTFINTGAFPSPATIGDGWEAHQELLDATHERGHWGLWRGGYTRKGEQHLGLYDSVEITPEKVTVEVKEDAKWSNGDDVIGQDVLTQIVAFRLFFNLASFEDVQERGEVNLAAEAITDVEADGKTAIFHSDGGYFGDMIEQDLWVYLLDTWEWGGVNFNTQIEPFDALHQTVMDLFRNAQNGEAQPWDLAEGPHLHVVVNEPFQNEDEPNHWPEYFREPDNVVTSGAWTLDEFRGDDQVILKKNEHHRFADEIDIEEIVYQWRDPDRGDQAHWSALNTGNLDYWDSSTPDHVAESFGEDIERKLTPAQGGICLIPNHDAEMFSEPEYRRGLYYALNNEQLATASNPDQFETISTPGGDLWDADEYFDEDFLSNNLRAYEHDPEQAAQIWQDAGFSKDGDQWLLPSGEPAELVVATDETSPDMELTLVSQLKDFGINAEILTLDGASYQERVDAGDLDIYIGGTGEMVGNTLYAVARSWAVVCQAWNRIAVQYNWFPDEQVEATEYMGEPGDYGIIAEATGEAFGEYSLEAPEIGDWGGSLREWHAPQLGWNAWRSPDEEEMQTNYEQLAWLVNWWMPMFPIANGFDQKLINQRKWQWPAEDSDAWTALNGHHMAGMGDMIQVD